MLFSSTSDQLIAHMRSDRQRAEERERIARFCTRWRLMTDDYRDLVIQELRCIFKDQDQANRVALLGDVSLNVYKQITEELHRFTGAKRAFKDGEQADPVYESICRDVIDFDLVMGEVSLALGAYNDCLIQVLPARVENGAPVGHPKVRVWLPHEVSVVPSEDDPAQPAEVMCEQMRPDGEIEVLVWTATEHYALGGGGRKVIPYGAESTENPLGRLPFVAVHKGLRPDGFWDSSTGEDLVQFTLMHAAQWSSVRHLLHQQSYKQLHVKGVDDDFPGFTSMGPGTVFSTGVGVEMSVLDVTVDPRAQTETLYAMLAQKLASYGFNVEDFRQNPGQAPPSGLARYLSRQRLLERRRRIAPFLRDAEWHLADLYRWAWNWNQPQRISETATFAVELIEETMVLSPMERIEVREKQLAVFTQERALGLATPVEQIAEYRGVSVEEAARLANEFQPNPQQAPAPAPAPNPAQE